MARRVDDEHAGQSQVKLLGRFLCLLADGALREEGRANLLRDAAGFFTLHIGAPDLVQQAGLAGVHVAHDAHDWRAIAQEVAVCMAGRATAGAGVGTCTIRRGLIFSLGARRRLQLNVLLPLGISASAWALQTLRLHELQMLPPPLRCLRLRLAASLLRPSLHAGLLFLLLACPGLLLPFVLLLRPFPLSLCKLCHLCLLRRPLLL
mmetsp:Transcript_773/g.2550  ORF Transcript_773/g.2550 Transcript_773/m.2550 type:complete len:206 (-) Transcript_773:237-854(-)